jgi:hypothetical protein
MTARDNRGGPRVPDGQARPASIPFAQGPNRSDLSALPGTPGTPLPSDTPSVAHGDAGPVRRSLSQIPLDALNPTKVGGLNKPSQFPGEPVTAGIDRGQGPGAEAMIPSPEMLSSGLAANQVKVWYPVIMRLASLPNATSQTKILAQRLRSQLGIQPHQIPKFPGER